jgi:hypothetical protein
MPANDCRTRRRLVFLATLIVAGCIGGSARAQDDEIVDDAVVVRPGAALQMLPQLTANIEQVDQWVFSRMGGSAAARSRLESALAIRIDDIERVCALSEIQKKKLKLAGHGDIKRFYDRVEDVKQKMQRMSNQPNNNIWGEVQPLQTEIFTGLFRDDSIFQKTIKKTLTEEQAARYEALLRERDLERKRATIELFVAHLDKALGLSEDQRTRLISLLTNEIPPPLKMGQSDYWYFMFRTSKLPESTLKPIFDAPQWRLLSRQFPQAQGMEQWLKNTGVIALAPGDTQTLPTAVMTKKAARLPAAAARAGFTGK